MIKVLETRQLEFAKSSFLIDLVKHDNGALYIEILQNIQNEKSEGQKIKINPTVLMDIVKVLLEFHEKIPDSQVNRVLYWTESEKKKLQDRYLKGVPIKDLALQFDTTEKVIEMILRNMNLKIVSDFKPEKRRFWRRRK